MADEFMPMQSKRHNPRSSNKPRRNLNDSIDSQNSAGRISNQSFNSSGSLIGKGSKYAGKAVTDDERDRNNRHRNSP